MTLAARLHGLAVMPYLAPLERPGARAMLGDLLAGVGDPQLLLRIGPPEGANARRPGR